MVLTLSRAGSGMRRFAPRASGNVRNDLDPHCIPVDGAGDLVQEDASGPIVAAMLKRV